MEAEEGGDCPAKICNGYESWTARTAMQVVNNIASLVKSRKTVSIVRKARGAFKCCGGKGSHKVSCKLR